MDGRILYTVSMSERLLSISELLIFLLIIFFRKPIIKFFSQFMDFEQLKKIFSVKKSSTVVINIMIVALFVMLAILIPVAVQEYQEIYRVYKAEKYEIVEGTVENFSTTKAEESFTIEGVPFFYNNNENIIGYHKVLAHGGVITGNGQKVKIGYIFYKGENRIVIIEDSSM